MTWTPAATARLGGSAQERQGKLLERARLDLSLRGGLGGTWTLPLGLSDDADKVRPIMKSAKATRRSLRAEMKTQEELLSAELAADPEFAAEWERLALARMVAASLAGYRFDHKLSQRALAKLIGVSQPRVMELESGEKNPQVETLMKIAAATGLEFAIDIAAVSDEPKLMSNDFKSAPRHVYAGASLRVAVA